MNKSWTIEVDHDPETGDLILPLPEEALELVGWKFFDTIKWTSNDDGSWTLTKVRSQDGGDDSGEVEEMGSKVP